ncbi:MAG: hypothetical protein GF399_05145 [Candidatus Coatesbacteria bacterium]|nr:hypothetical protein [Candidatus Coatesbacteria bacterium]
MEPIRDNGGNPIAYLEHLGCRVYLRDIGGNRLGWYDKHLDRTYDAAGNQVSYGDTLTRLIP